MNGSRVRTTERNLLFRQERLEKKRMDDYLKKLAQSAPLELRDPKEQLPQDKRCEESIWKVLKRMTHEDQKEIRLVLQRYSKASVEIPFRVSLSENPKPNLETIDMFTTLLRRFTYFSTLFPEFAALSKEDQCNLLRSAILKMCFLRGVACFDNENVSASHSSAVVKQMAPWFLSKLDDLRELNQWSEVRLNLDVDEVNKVKQAFVSPRYNSMEKLDVQNHIK
ncbi:Ecdysone-inducible protein E75 [Orchesella cincta]|uniref:Ecdysone-inducible protein E75 n=1 Tax=Orchesella cincta TaxID=48709 RepID=A0A1D2M9Y6_ORCCI|nr:Ecdysone-inducible protein E75 [Orchesella cincta]